MLVFVCRELRMKLNASSKQSFSSGRNDIVADSFLGSIDTLGESENKITASERAPVYQSAL